MEGRAARPLRRRAAGVEVLVHLGDGHRWLELEEGYRVVLWRAGSGWSAARAGSPSVIARARTVAMVVEAVVRHWRALTPG